MPCGTKPRKMFAGGIVNAQDFGPQRIEEEKFEKVYNRRKKDGVRNPRKQTDISFAAHLAVKARKKPSLPFSARLKRIP
jgi:hypothetical protein